jgi:pimeloyl-ACP methyl ester carboxylesterase
MKIRGATALAALGVLIQLWAAAPGFAAEPPRRPGLTACKEPGMPVEALCGTYEVFENRAARTGRKIPLHIVVLPATGPDPLPDPFVYFAGGPGEAAVPWGLFWAEQLAGLRSKRDVLLVDLRGTGRSGELACPELRGEQSIQGFLDDFLPVDKVRACRDRLKKEVDLSWYTTDAAVDDVEEVRLALGYGPLNLMGSSFGTRAVLTYLRRHPRSVRTATLDGVLPPDVKLLVAMPRNTQEALDGLIAECEGDPACRGTFPKLREEVAAVLHRATTEPVRVELTDPEAGKTQELRLTRAAVAQTLRYMLYAPSEAVRVPLEVHRAAQGDWKPLALSARSNGGMGGSAEGLYQSVTCAEEVAFVKDEEIASAVAGTFLGDFRIRRQRAACEGWPIRDLGPDLHAPVVSDVPALLISGQRDPATPVSNGARAARTLKRSRHLIIADGAHSLDGMQGADCVPRLIDAFIEAGAVEGLDTSCIDRMRRPELLLSFGDPELTPEVTVAQSDLERLQGSYTNQEMGMAAKVELVERHLRFSVTQGPGFQFLLIPTSPTRFRAEGEGLAPGLAVVFQVTGGKATALTVVQPGKPELLMTRQ